MLLGNTIEFTHRQYSSNHRLQKQSSDFFEKFGRDLAIENYNKIENLTNQPFSDEDHMNYLNISMGNDGLC